jgi:hypothetical protein
MMAGQQDNASNRLKKSCEDFKNFPCNLFQTDLFQYSLEAYRKALGDEDGAYFEENKRSISFYDLVDHTGGRYSYCFRGDSFITVNRISNIKQCPKSGRNRADLG